LGGDVLTKIADLANPSRRTEKYNELQCAVVRLPVRDGIATAERTTAVETARVNLVAAGTINLRNETLDLALRTNVKEGLGIGAGEPRELTRVTGTSPARASASIPRLRARRSPSAARSRPAASLLGEAALKAPPTRIPCQTAAAGGTAPVRAAGS
jgi:hypothetical protein